MLRVAPAYLLITMGLAHCYSEDESPGGFTVRVGRVEEELAVGHNATNKEQYSHQQGTMHLPHG